MKAILFCVVLAVVVFGFIINRGLPGVKSEKRPVEYIKIEQAPKGMSDQQIMDHNREALSSKKK